MQTVSADYKIDINNTLRNISYIRVNINMADPDIMDSNTTTNNGEVYFSDATETDRGTSVPTSYATMEHNRLILNGQQALPPEVTGTIDFYQGFVGTEISDASGDFSTNPSITTVFSELTHFAGLSFKFDEIVGCYPTEFDIVCYNGVDIVETTTHYPSTNTYITPLGVPASVYCDKIVVTFKGTSVPNRRMRLSYMIFGIMKEWTDSTITNSVWNRDTDLLSSKIAINSFEFTSIDLDPDTGLPEYNPDNPTGMWQYIEELQPVSVQYGYELDTGGIEWVQGASTFTTGEIKSDSSGAVSTVTFYSTSILNQLTDIYYRGIYNETPVTLYSLAEDVFDFADLRILSNGETPYFIDTALQSIYTSSPIPEIKTYEALQMIANAGRCVLYVDRTGCIRMEQLDESTVQDFTLDFSNMTSTPVISKVPPLKTVTTSYTGLILGASTESLTKVSLSFTTNTECRITYDEGVPSSVTTTGTLTVVGSPVYYAGSCVVTLTGTGDIEIFGKKLTRTTTGVVYDAGQVGFDCPIENSLINTSTDAIAFATWVGDVLSRRNKYTVNERGYPELDTLDVISAQTLFSEALDVTILTTKLTYNGSLSAQTTFLAKENV